MHLGQIPVRIPKATCIPECAPTSIAQDVVMALMAFYGRRRHFERLLPGQQSDHTLELILVAERSSQNFKLSEADNTSWALSMCFTSMLRG